MLQYTMKVISPKSRYQLKLGHWPKSLIPKSGDYWSLSVTNSTNLGFTAVTGASQYLIMPKHMSKELAEPMNIN